MIKKIIPFFIILSLFIGAPMVTFAATTGTAAKTTVAKKIVKKTTKKKKTKKKEKLTLAPALFTLETAPHSAKPVAKKKVATKKKSTVLAKKKN